MSTFNTHAPSGSSHSGLSREGLDGIVSVSLRLERAHPDHLLRLGAGLPRGFWAWEESWIAHTGAVTSIAVPEGAPASERFSRVWEAALPILRMSGGAAADHEAPFPDRMYGGFSFGEDHRQEGIWSGFPPACFLLPEVELSSGPQGLWLRLRANVERSEDRQRVGSRLAIRAEELRGHLEAEPEAVEHSPVTARRSTTERGAWDRTVMEVLQAIRAGQVSKIVLARTMDIEVAEQVDPAAVALTLWRRNPKAHVYLFDPLPGASLIGAAPETIATLHGGRVRATAVAGTAPRGATDEEQEALAQELLDSEKDTVEHAISVEDMVRRLEDLGLIVDADSAPHVLTLSGIQHLESRLEAPVPPGLEVLRILEVLHPTLAVCGWPRDAAFEYLSGQEPFQRGWYAGPVGWFDGNGDGVFVPALRSAVSDGIRWRLFAGAGIVSGSDSESEWRETNIKFQAVLEALAANGVVE